MTLTLGWILLLTGFVAGWVLRTLMTASRDELPPLILTMHAPTAPVRLIRRLRGRILRRRTTVTPPAPASQRDELKPRV